MDMGIGTMFFSGVVLGSLVFVQLYRQAPASTRMLQSTTYNPDAPWGDEAEK
jgi:hypothetical protein